jgi:flagellin
VPITIGSNVQSLRAQRNLAEGSSALSKTFERLSSGQRINRASDDPAGLAVSSNLQAQSRVINRARLNLSDGVSLLTIADSALSNITGLLTRMNELSEQAANGVFSRFQRMSIHREYQALEDEIGRIGGSTVFNKLDLLGGKMSANPVTQAASGPVSGTSTRLSADGRFEFWMNAASTKLYVRDSESGDTRTITPASGYAGFNTTGARVLNNGDALYLASNGGNKTDLFYYSYETNTSRRLTASKSLFDVVWSVGAALSEDGSTLIFGSTTQYQDGGTLADGSTLGAQQTIYTLDMTTGVFRTIGLAGVSVLQLSISADGQSAAFTSSTDVLGNGNSSNQVFTVDLSGSSKTIKQLTSGSGFPGGATIQRVLSGGDVLFTSTANPLGQNTSGYEQIFKVTAQSALSQITHFNFDWGGLSQYGGLAGITLDGKRATFLGYYDITGQNPNQIAQAFSIDLQTGIASQLTNHSGINYDATNVAVSADGSRIIYSDISSSGIYELDPTPAASRFDFEAGYGASGNIVAALGSVGSTIRGVGAYELSSQMMARSALYRVKQNLENVAMARGVLGAALSRLNVAQDLSAASRSELESANSRIRDTDIAGEAAQLVRLQILQNVGATLLAQANQNPRLALQLLAG